MDEDSEPNFYSRTAKFFQRIGHDSIRLMNWMANYDG